MTNRCRNGPFDWLFLTMCHQRLGGAQEAIRWYERSVKWLEEKQTRNSELKRFRAETAAALGR